MSNKEMSNREWLLSKLKESSITVGSYMPSENVKSMSNVVITLNDKPLLALGSTGDLPTLSESKKLIESPVFFTLVDKTFNKGCTDIFLEVKNILGSDINWKEKEICITKSKVGVTELGNEEADLVWIVFGEEALGFATLLCITKEIESIINITE